MIYDLRFTRITIDDFRSKKLSCFAGTDCRKPTEYTNWKKCWQGWWPNFRNWNYI